MTIRVCDIDPLFVITGLHHTAGDTMMATSFIPFNTAHSLAAGRTSLNENDFNELKKTKQHFY